MSSVTAARRTWRKQPFIKNPRLRWGLGLGFALYLAFAFGTLDINWIRVLEGLPRGQKFIAAFFPPDFISRWDAIQEGIIESLWMTVTSTVIGIALSIPVGLGAAKNLAPAPVYYFCRGVLAVSRSFQEVILAIFFVKLFGFGPFAGFVTLSVATVGFYGKLLAEDIEDMDPVQAEAVKATGASWFQWLNYSVQPQVMPRMIGLGLYRFDINFRASAIVGIVGGGGIGATLNTAFDRYEFDFGRRHPAGDHRHRHGGRIHVGLCPQVGAVTVAVSAHDGMKIWQRRSTRLNLLVWGAWLVAVAIFVVCWQLISEVTMWEFVYDAPSQAADLGNRMVPLDFGYMSELWRAVWDTINIATLGTVLALILAVPTAYCAALNTTPSRTFVRPIALFIIVSSRSINSLIWALMLVTIVGPGVFAGVIAIGFRSIGFCAKLLYEAIEEIDPNQVEAVAATGASQPQTMVYGIVPQVLPAFAGISVFRWDINIRESTVLGLVGAGGIGLQLNASIMNLAWTRVSLILLVIIATVIVSEWVSAKIRHAII